MMSQVRFSFGTHCSKNLSSKAGAGNLTAGRGHWLAL